MKLILFLEKTYQIGKINILDFLNQPFAKLKAKYNQKEKIDHELIWMELNNDDSILDSNYEYQLTFLNHHSAYNSNIQEISFFIEIPLNDFSKLYFEKYNLHLINHIEDFNLLKSQLDKYRSVSVKLNKENLKLSKMWFMKLEDSVTVALQVSIFNSIF